MSEPLDPHEEEALQVYDLMMRLTEAEETLAAIRRGDVDALVVKTPSGQHVYTLQGADNAYRVLMETLNEGALTLSLDGTVYYANTQFGRLVGVPLEKVLGGDFHQFVAPGSRATLDELVAKGIRNTSKGEIFLVDAAGNLIPVMMSMSAVGTDGLGKACTVVVTDLTELKYAQAELSRARDELETRVEARTEELAKTNRVLRHEIARRQQLEDELRRRADQLAEADKRKDEFLSMLAHELRNPLSPALTALHVMRFGKPDEASYLRSCEVAERQLRHLARLVDDLLDVSRITRGRIELRLQPLDLGHAISRALDSVCPVLDSRSHTISVSLPDPPLRVNADPTRLEQIICNLLTNAAKYTEPGGEISISAAQVGKEAVIRVRDNGMGIPADTLPHVFELFVQAERTLDRSQGGLGIGLTLVRRLAELHGGSVSVTSEGSGRGSEFTVRLPALEPSIAADAAPRANGNGSHTEPRRILVVDDNVDAAESLAELLALHGHRTEVAHNGLGALSGVEALQPDVVLCDIGMPGMDGYEVARQLRARHDGTGPVLIALTGYGQDADRRRSREAGFDYHLVKPVDPEQLRLLLASL